MFLNYTQENNSKFFDVIYIKDAGFVYLIFVA